MTLKGLRNICLFLLVGCPILLLGLGAGPLILGALHQWVGFSGKDASPSFPSGRDWLNIVAFIMAVAYAISWIPISVEYELKLERAGKKWGIREASLAELLVMIIVGATAYMGISMATITGLYLAGRLEYTMSMSP